MGWAARYSIHHPNSVSQSVTPYVEHRYLPVVQTTNPTLDREASQDCLRGALGIMLSTTLYCTSPPWLIHLYSSFLSVPLLPLPLSLLFGPVLVLSWSLLSLSSNSSLKNELQSNPSPPTHPFPQPHTTCAASPAIAHTLQGIRRPRPPSSSSHPPSAARVHSTVPNQTYASCSVDHIRSPPSHTRGQITTYPAHGSEATTKRGIRRVDRLWRSGSPLCPCHLLVALALQLHLASTPTTRHSQIRE